MRANMAMVFKWVSRKKAIKEKKVLRESEGYLALRELNGQIGIYSKGFKYDGLECPNTLLFMDVKDNELDNFFKNLK